MIAYKKFEINRRFGVELEMGNTINRSIIRKIIEKHSARPIKEEDFGQSRNNNYWHIKLDASCASGDNPDERGIEVASYVASTKKDLTHISMIAQRLQDAGAEVNKNCGLHIHVEVADLDIAQIGRILQHWIKAEWLVLQSLPKYRSMFYCLPFEFMLRSHIKRYVFSPAVVWELCKPASLAHHNNESRWRSINLVNYANGLKNKKWNRRTLEFRLPEGTLEKKEVENWTRFCLNFVDFACHQDFQGNLESASLIQALMHLGLHHSDKNFYILSPDLMETKTWFIERIIKNDLNVAFLKRVLNKMWEPIKTF